MERVKVESLPIGKEIPGVKRWDEEKGEFAQISYLEEVRHLAMFEIKKGFSRGNHYHQKKEEIFYVFGGRIRAVLFDLETREKGEVYLEKGDKIRIGPRCAHVLHGLDDTLVVEYSPQVYELDDTYRVDVEALAGC